MNELRPDWIIRFDGNNQIDKRTSHPITPDETHEDLKLNKEKLIELIQNDDPVISWMELALKYALKYHDTIRNSGASDVLMFTAQESFPDLWTGELRDQLPKYQSLQEQFPNDIT